MSSTKESARIKESPNFSRGAGLQNWRHVTKSIPVENKKKMRSSSSLQPSARAIIFNFICVCSLCITIILFKYVGKPYHRGFFCDDESISKPYKDSTVHSSVALAVGLLVPTICILVIEVPGFYKKRLGESKPFYKTPWFRWLAVVFTVFLVGAAVNTVLTDVGKYTIGRLRPHFFDVCRPDFKRLNCSSGSRKNFITDYECTGDQGEVREARLSFPSGHSSFSAYCMVFLVLYIEFRMTFCKNLKLFKPFVQFVLVLLALLCGLSRISDYKHHWSDVLAGLILGTSVAVYFIYRVLQLHRLDLSRDESPPAAFHSIQQNRDFEQGET